MAPRWLTLALFCFALSPLHAQESLQSRFETARVAWDEGHFIEALEAMEGILESPGGGEFLEPIALDMLSSVDSTVRSVVIDDPRDPR